MIWTQNPLLNVHLKVLINKNKGAIAILEKLPFLKGSKNYFAF
jgi:hypothetical protein